MSKAANELVDIIRGIVQEEISKKDSTMLCRVKEKKDDNHYDLIVVPDQENIIHNVTNMTKFDLKDGDYVYVYQINGQLNNSFICYKLLPYINETVTSASGTSYHPRSTISIPLNSSQTNRNETVSYFINDINGNSQGVAFLTNETNWTQARPYYNALYGKPYYMMGISKPTQAMIGNFSFDTSVALIYQVDLTLCIGFTLHNQTGLITTPCVAVDLEFVTYDQEGQSYATSLRLPGCLPNKDPKEITLQTLTLRSEKPISKIEVNIKNSTLTNCRFNLFNLGFTYKKA